LRLDSRIAEYNNLKYNKVQIKQMFRTSNTEIVKNCQSYFSFDLLSELWSRRVKRFDVKYATCGGSFVNYGNNVT